MPAADETPDVARLSSSVNPDNLDTDDLTDCSVLTGVFVSLEFNIFTYWRFFHLQTLSC